MNSSINPQSSTLFPPFFPNSLLTKRSIVDWDFTLLVPLAASVHFPAFLANIPGWNTSGQPDDFVGDREYLAAAIQARYCNRPADGRRISRLLDNSFERQFFEMSLSIRQVNEQYIRLRGGDVDIDAVKDHLMEQLTAFLARNQDLRNSERVLSLIERLK